MSLHALGSKTSGMLRIDHAQNSSIGTFTVAQLSSPLQQFATQFQQVFSLLVETRFAKSWTQFVAVSRGWLSLLAVLLLLWMWNWQLVISGGMGLSGLVMVYLVLQGQWRLPQVNWQTLGSRSHRPVVLALLSGLVISLSTYLSLGIWSESGGSWLALGMILQGFGIMALLGLLVWQVIERRWSNPTDQAQQWTQFLSDLSDSDPLKRLIAIRRITQELTQPGLAAASTSAILSPSHIRECFRLMLNRETEPVVCRALLESLQCLGDRNHRQQLQGGQSLPFVAQQRVTHTQ